MSRWTDKMEQFCRNKAAGVANKEAAVAAGYLPTNADTQAINLLKRADVKKRIKALSAENAAAPKRNRPQRPGKKADAPADDGGFGLLDEFLSRNAMPADTNGGYTDAKDFLIDLMNKQGVPIAVRADAAKQLLPYQHARISDVGKKQTKKDRAAAATTTQPAEGAGKRPKFGTKAPPLRLVANAGK